MATLFEGFDGDLDENEIGGGARKYLWDLIREEEGIASSEVKKNKSESKKAENWGGGGFTRGK